MDIGPLSSLSAFEDLTLNFLPRTIDLRVIPCLFPNLTALLLNRDHYVISDDSLLVRLTNLTCLRIYEYQLQLLRHPPSQLPPLQDLSLNESSFRGIGQDILDQLALLPTLRCLHVDLSFSTVSFSKFTQLHELDLEGQDFLPECINNLSQLKILGLSGLDNIEARLANFEARWKNLSTFFPLATKVSVIADELVFPKLLPRFPNLQTLVVCGTAERQPGAFIFSHADAENLPKLTSLVLGNEPFQIEP